MAKVCDGSEGVSIVAGGAGMQVTREGWRRGRAAPAGEHGESAAAALEHGGGEACYERRARHTVGAHVHYCTEGWLVSVLG